MVKKTIELNSFSKHLLEFIFLSCEDLAQPDNGCKACPLVLSCIDLQKLLFDRCLTDADNKGNI